MGLARFKETRPAGSNRRGEFHKDERGNVVMFTGQPVHNNVVLDMKERFVKFWLAGGDPQVSPEIRLQGVQ